jgi:hypothetical protein
LSSTPCFDYRTLNNSRYCAPAILCSILESCNNITYTCASTTSICIVNSCCSLQAVCLPLLTTNFCPIGNKILHIQRLRVLKNKLKCFHAGNFWVKSRSIAVFLRHFLPFAYTRLLWHFWWSHWDLLMDLIWAPTTRITWD